MPWASVERDFSSKSRETHTIFLLYEVQLRWLSLNSTDLTGHSHRPVISLWTPWILAALAHMASPP